VAILIDTDLLIELEHGSASPDLAAMFGREEATISVITVSELLHGVHRATGARRTLRRALVERILSAFDPVPIDEPVARVHAEIWAGLVGQGNVIAAHDLWIAATALTHGLGVATRNVADFVRVPGLRLVAPEATL